MQGNVMTGMIRPGIIIDTTGIIGATGGTAEMHV
jgi:hypothetical protein